MQPSRALFGIAALAMLGACSVPTEAPKYDTEWNVPAQNTTIAVNSFLPSGVTATPDNSAFQVVVSPSTTTIVRQLGQDCAACAASNGQSIPKPAFTGGGSAAVSLPANVTGATLVRDTLSVTIANGFNFDPIRPSASARGYFVILVKSGATTIGRDSLDGAAVALPSGNTTRKIPLSGSVTGANGLQITTTLNSPLGDVVAINAAQTLTVTGSTGQFFVSSAQVNLTNQTVSSGGSDLDLSGVDNLANHVTAGTLFLTVNNPFNATGTLNIQFNGGKTPITKTVALAAGASTPSISFNQAELQSLFGSKISIAFKGTVNGAGITVTPGQAVTVASRLQVTINTGTK